jgi:hypothetical protein
MATRFTLSYQTPSGWIALTNLYESAARQIREAQQHLGSTDFRLQRQGHWYGPFVMEILVGAGKTMLNGDEVETVRRYVETH